MIIYMTSHPAAGVCLPFIVSSQRLPGWEYSVFVFLVLNLISFLIIFIGYACTLHVQSHDATTSGGRGSSCVHRYAAIFVKVKASMDALGDSSSSTTNEYRLAKKLAIIVATDFLCWVGSDIKINTNFLT